MNIFVFTNIYNLLIQFLLIQLKYNIFCWKEKYISLNRRKNTIIHTLINIYFLQYWVLNDSSSHNASNQWHLCLEVYRSTFIHHTYFATSPVHFGFYKTWSLVCLYRHLLNPWVVTNLFCLDTPECSHSNAYIPSTVHW